MVNIRRKTLYTVLAVLLGVIGAILRRIEIQTIFDPVTGLAKIWEPITIALALLSLGTAVFFAVIFAGLKKLSVGEGYVSAMTSDNQMLFVLSLVSAIGLACGSVMYYFQNKSIMSIILTILGLVASMAVIILSRPTSKSSESDGNAALSVLFVLFVCLFMILEYKARSADPVLLDYVYDFLALCPAALAFYYKAGFAFGRPKPAQTILYMLLALFFSIIAAAGTSGMSQSIIFISLALLIIRDLAVLTGNLKE